MYLYVDLIDTAIDPDIKQLIQVSFGKLKKFFKTKTNTKRFRATAFLKPLF
jgi:hypothetical protein